MDIYFARQQVSERLSAAKEDLPPGTEPPMGPISTGLGEVFMYTVEFVHPHGKGAPVADGKAGWQTDGEFCHARRRAADQRSGTFELPATVQDWIIAPQLKGVKDVAGVDSIGGYVKQYHVQPDPMKLISYGLSFSHVIEALETTSALARDMLNTRAKPISFAPPEGSTRSRFPASSWAAGMARPFMSATWRR